MRTVENVLECLEPRLCLSATDADVTFGGSGKVTLPFTPNIVRVQPNGDVLAAETETGRLGVPGGSSAIIHVVELSSNGALRWQADVTVPYLIASVDVLTEQPDGKVIFGGTTGQGGQEHGLYLRRINADGTVDASFQPVNGGAISVHYNDALVRPGGQVVLAGSLMDEYGVWTESADGKTAGSLGGVEFAGGTYSSALRLALQPDGKVLVVGTVTLNGKFGVAVERFNADGSVDPKFGNGDTTVATGLGGTPRQLRVLSDGDILIGLENYAGNGSSVVAFTSGGQIDQTFATKGVLNDPGGLDVLMDVQPQAGGTFLITGTDADGHVALARYTSAGVPDTSFATGGVSSSTVSIGVRGQLALTTDGRIVEWSDVSPDVLRWTGAAGTTGVGGGSDTTPPTVTLHKLSKVTVGARRYTFTVTYRDTGSGIDASTIRSGNVDLRWGKHRASAGELVSLTPVTEAGGGTAYVATYSVRPPGGRWNAVANGHYLIELLSGQVKDASGNAAAAGVLATMDVKIRA